MWILIIFLQLFSESTAVHSVPGFTTWKACDVAAKRFQAQVQTYSTHVETLCVRSTEP
jgi:hypothetical protein